jgi:hypothetical protein
MTKDEMLAKVVRHLEEAHEGPFLVEGGPLEALEYRFAELYNAVRMLGAVVEELVKESKGIERNSAG